MTRMLWITVAVAVVGLFMLIAGIGPLWLPIVVIAAGLAIAVQSKLRPGDKLG